MAGATLIARWLSDRRFYQLNIVAGDSTNPEYRISDDTRMATEPLVEFAIGLSNAVLTAVTFIGILWAWSAAAFELGGRQPAILPGYMVWAVIIYSAHRLDGTC